MKLAVLLLFALPAFAGPQEDLEKELKAADARLLKIYRMPEVERACVALALRSVEVEINDKTFTVYCPIRNEVVASLDRR